MATKQLLSVDYFNNMNLRNEYISVEPFNKTKVYNFVNIYDDTLVSNIANDFDVLVTTNNHNQNYAYVQIENGVLEIEHSKYQKKIILKPKYKVDFEASMIFNNDLNNMFKYNKKSFQKYLDFYTDAYITLERLKIEFKNGIQNERETLANSGAFVLNGDNSTDFISFGEFRNIYYKVSHELRKDDNNKFYFLIYTSKKESVHEFTKTEDFISNIEQGRIINIDYFETSNVIDSSRTSHVLTMAKYNMFRDIILVLKNNGYIVENHIIKVGEDVLTINVNGDTNCIKLNDSTLHVTSDKLSMQMIRKFRTELFKLFKAY